MPPSARQDSAQLIDSAAAHLNAGNLAQAEAFCRQVLQAEPGRSDALHLLGLIAYQGGRLAEAEDFIRKAIAANPRIADYHNNLGSILNAAGRPVAAEECFRKTLKLVFPSGDSTRIAEVHNNLGSALQRQGRLVDAIASYRSSLELMPRQPVAWNNLAASLQSQGLSDEAERCYRRALEINPDYGDALLNLGNVLGESGRHTEAIELYRRVIEIAPGFAVAHNNLGNALRGQGRLGDALAAYLNAISLKPDFLEAWTNYLLSLNYADGYSRQFVFDEHLKFARQFEASLKATWREHGNDRDPNRKLKVGYVSADFRRHSVAYFFEPVLQHHGDDFEIYCYYNNRISDEVTERLKSFAGHWREIGMLSDDAVAQLIREDGIDILVDLAGHTAAHRLLVFARKPAPVQVTMYGYLGTTGLSAMDYRLTDRYLEPEGIAEPYYVEKLWRVAGASAAYRPCINNPGRREQLQVNPTPALTNGHVTFGSMNNIAKLTPPTIALWSRTLHAVPGSKLLIESPGLGQEAMRADFLARFAARGIGEDRLILLERTPQAQYRLYNEIDIALDPFPCAGGTTTCDALWMGVPLVTLAGEHFASRIGLTALCNVGHPEWVAHDEEEYVAKLAKLAADFSGLNEIRQKLRAEVESSPLFDEAGVARDLEAAYRGMWQKWCEQ